MKRWLTGLVLPGLTSLLIVLFRATQASLLQDTDTAVLLKAIREAKAPLSWFATDWPLKNHFYRPLSTLSFELDNRLYGDWAAGYGLTNALLAAGCVLLVYWLLREMYDTVWIAVLASTVFGLWHILPGPIPLLPQIFALLALLASAGFARGGRFQVLVGIGGLAFAATQFAPLNDFGFRIVGWLPGRTASTMALFALASAASYARYERLRFAAVDREPTALDKPATKGTVVLATGSGQLAWVWVVGCWFGLVGALLCYEQAVMVPAVLLGWAVVVRLRGGRPRWSVHAVNWGILFGYLALRAAIVPTSVSGYQAQQFRNGPGVLLSIADYVFPAWNWIAVLATMLSVGWLMLLTLDPWKLVLQVFGNAAAIWQVWKHDSRWATLFALAAAAVSYLPMAWLQQFGHYNYWPAAYRAAFAVLLAKVALDGFVSAVSPRAIQAPLRQRPAPGSLPRR